MTPGNFKWQVNNTTHTLSLYGDKLKNLKESDETTEGMWKPIKNVSESAIAFIIQNLESLKTQKDWRSIN